MELQFFSQSNRTAFLVTDFFQDTKDGSKSEIYQNKFIFIKDF